MKYIDAEKLKAEIERQLERYDPHYTSAGFELTKLLSFVNSLQQEQSVDLEKEIEIDDLLEEYAKMSEKHMQDQNNPDMYSFWDGFRFCIELISHRLGKKGGSK